MQGEGLFYSPGHYKVGRYGRCCRCWEADTDRYMQAPTHPTVLYMQVQIPVFSFRDCSPAMVTYCLRACASPVRHGTVPVPYSRVIDYLSVSGDPERSRTGSRPAGQQAVPSRGKPQPDWVLLPTYLITSSADMPTHDFVNWYLRDIGGTRAISFSDHGCRSVGQLTIPAPIVHRPLWSAQSEIRAESWQHEDRRRSTPQCPCPVWYLRILVRTHTAPSTYSTTLYYLYYLVTTSIG